MLTVKKAQKTILENITSLGTIDVKLLDALNFTLAKSITSKINVPLMDNSSMDGYAIKFSDSIGANKNPVTLKIAGIIQAGDIFKKTLLKGQAIRIMTGAVVPNGADAVIPFEDTDEYKVTSQTKNIPTNVTLYKVVKKMDNIRRKAEDTKKGQVILKAGTTLGPAHVGLAASVGIATLPVIRKPIVAIISSGDEIIRPPRPIKPGQVYDSNTYSLALQVLKIGAKPLVLQIAKDNLTDIKKKVQLAITKADIVISSAGVSKGDFDLMKTVLMTKGVMNFWSIKMRPGKPLMFGMLRDKDQKHVPHIGLPGNPVSAMVTFEIFAKPAVLKMMGQDPNDLRTVEAILKNDIINADGREVYARVSLKKTNGKYYATTTGNQGSGILQSMSRANGLAICPSNMKSMNKGKKIKVILL